jgi:hypothetical protein
LNEIKRVVEGLLMSLREDGLCHISSKADHMLQNQLQAKQAQASYLQANPTAAPMEQSTDGTVHGHFALAERRNTPRMPVIKSAKIITGSTVNQSIYNCLVLDESPSGVLVDLGAVFSLPEEMALHMTCGTSYKARRCWAVGTKMGLAFTGPQMLSANAMEKLAQLGRIMQAQGLPAVMAVLRAQHFFESDEVRRSAEGAEVAYRRLEAVLLG